VRFLLSAFMLSLCVSGSAEEAPIRLLVVTGSHPFDARFYSLFDGYKDIEWDKKTQSSKPCAAYSKDFAKDYDAVLLYDFEMKISDDQKAAFESAFGEGKGLIVLHHALCSHPTWPKFRVIAGGQFFFEARDGFPKSDYKGNVQMTYRAADPEHPVTKGVSEIKVIEEPYKHVYRPDNAKPLLMSSNPESDEVVAWTTEYGKSRVIAIEPGHGGDIFDEPNYRRFIAQAIRWVARRDEPVK
jgi:type 1 glutamine amidotransferase